MNLGEITYAEFSLLRDLVRAKQLDIWKKEWAPRLKKELTVEEIGKIFRKVMREGAVHKACHKSEVAVPITDRDCCILLLRRMDKEEQKVREALELAKKS